MQPSWLPAKKAAKSTGRQLNKSLLMVVASSVLWALQPAFLLAAGRSIPDNTLAFLLVNVASLSMLSLFALAYFHSRAGIAKAFEERKVRVEFTGLIAFKHQPFAAP